MAMPLKLLGWFSPCQGVARLLSPLCPIKDPCHRGPVGKLPSASRGSLGLVSPFANGTSSIICEAPCTLKRQAPCSKTIENFKTWTVAHQTTHGAAGSHVHDAHLVWLGLKCIGTILPSSLGIKEPGRPSNLPNECSVHP